MLGAAIVLLGVLSACGGDQPSVRQTATPVERTHTTRTFAAPLRINVPEPFTVQPSAESRTFLTWVAADPHRVRFMLPTAVYRMGAKQSSKPPADYLAYFEAEGKGRIEISDRIDRTVGGSKAELFTAETMTEDDVDGLFGCTKPAPKDSDEDCFGPQYGYTFRIALIHLNDGTTMVAWTPVRDAYRDEQKALFARFHTMLDSIAFR